MLRLPLAAVYIDERRNVSRGGRTQTEASLSGLADDLRSHGQLEPCGVVPLRAASWVERPDELEARGVAYVLIYGYRRAAAARLAGLDAILAIDCGPLTDDAAQLANLAENWAREPPNEYDLTIAVAAFVARKVDRRVIASRTHRTPAWIEESAWIVRRVAPRLLRHYAIDSRREMRRKMSQLANVEGGTDRERHEAQAALWAQWEVAEQTERRTDPDAGRARPTRTRRTSDAPATRTELYEAIEAVTLAREWHDGAEWIPMGADVRAALALALRWAARPTDYPWR